MVLVTDGDKSFVFFSYGDISWSGNGRVYIGYESGNTSYTLPQTFNNETAEDIETTSNVGVTGLYVYRVDQDDIIHPTNDITCEGDTEDIVSSSGFQLGSGMEAPFRCSPLIPVAVNLTVSKYLPLVLGDYVTLTCSHGNSITNYQYSWYHNNTVLPDQTTPILVLPGVTRRDLGEYMCEVTSIPFRGSATINITARGMLTFDLSAYTKTFHCHCPTNCKNLTLPLLPIPPPSLFFPSLLPHPSPHTSLATIPFGPYPARVTSSCPTASGRQDIHDDISREVVQLLVEEFAVRPYGRLRAFPANSCQEISHAHPNIGAGLYWISQDGGEPIQMYCNI